MTGNGFNGLAIVFLVASIFTFVMAEYELSPLLSDQVPTIEKAILLGILSAASSSIARYLK